MGSSEEKQETGWKLATIICSFLLVVASAANVILGYSKSEDAKKQDKLEEQIAVLQSRLHEIGGDFEDILKNGNSEPTKTTTGNEREPSKNAGDEGKEDPNEFDLDNEVTPDRDRAPGEDAQQTPRGDIELLETASYAAAKAMNINRNWKVADIKVDGLWARTRVQDADSSTYAGETFFFKKTDGMWKIVAIGNDLREEDIPDAPASIF